MISNKQINHVAICTLYVLLFTCFTVIYLPQITILQLAGLLKQPDTSSRKLTLSRLSSTTLPFTIVSIQSNLENEDALAVCGLKDCHVITYGHAGSVASHVALPLQLETGNFVIKAVWVPGEQTKVALLTADFVKVITVLC